MRSIKTVGMLIILALSLSAVAAATASAANPEFLDNVAGNTFTGKSGEGKLVDPTNGLTILCKKDSVTGEITGAKTTTATVTFEECTTNGLATNSLGGKAKTIVVKVKGELCYINEAAKEVGTYFTLGETVHAEVPLAGELFEISGTVVGKVEPVNVLQTTGTVTLTKTNPTTCSGKAAKLTLQVNHDGKPLGAQEETKEELTFAKDVVVMG